MDRPLLDRWTDTVVFRAALLFSGIAVLPVLALGALVTVVGGAAMLKGPFSIEPEHVLLGLLSVGGALGFVGYTRAHWGVKDPGHHNVTTTLLCLGAGVVAAAAVATYVAFGTLDALRSPESWGSPLLAVPATLFAIANAVWAVAGVAWMQRLPHRYAEETGRNFETLPVVLLFVAVTLAVASAVATTTL